LDSLGSRSRAVRSNLDDLNQFILDTIHGDLRNDAVAHEASIFFGYRGPWYTVGYRMATTIERELGRPALVATLTDPREFVARYNEAAMAENARKGGHLPLFSAEILKAVGTVWSSPVRRIDIWAGAPRRPWAERPGLRSQALIVEHRS
jgi:transposase InsO family protein